MSEWKMDELERGVTKADYATYCRNRTELLRRYCSVNKSLYLSVLRGMQSVHDKCFSDKRDLQQPKKCTCVIVYGMYIFHECFFI